MTGGTSIGATGIIDAVLDVVGLLVGLRRGSRGSSNGSGRGGRSGRCLGRSCARPQVAEQRPESERKPKESEHAQRHSVAHPTCGRVKGPDSREGEAARKALANIGRRGNLLPLGSGGQVLLGLLIIWFGMGIAGGMIMSNKGRSGCGGFALGFLLGPIGLVIALVMGADHREMEKRSLRQGEMRKCPTCAELVRIEATKCRYCGSELPSVRS